MNRTADFDFTIVIPVYNEVDNIYELGRRLTAFFGHCRLNGCALFVNDGSSDGSGARIEEICRETSRFFYINFTHNCGLSAALKAGIDYTESPYLGYMDADMQTDPEDFNILLEYAGEFTMVTGIRALRKDSIFKRMQSRIANGFRRMMTHDGAADTGCPLKVIRTDAARKLPLFKGMHRFLPALVLLQEGGCYKQVPVHHSPRLAGKSKFHLWNRLWGPFADCFAYRWMKKRYINYKLESSYLGTDDNLHGNHE